MRVKLRLPGKLHIPHRLRQAITTRVYSRFDRFMTYTMDNLLPRHYSSASQHGEVEEQFRTLGKSGFIKVGLEVCSHFDTALMYVTLVIFGIEFSLHIEDIQEDDCRPVFGDSLEVKRRPPFLPPPREGYSYH